MKIEHGEINPKGEKAISATAIAAERPTDPTRWALIIAVQNYDDKADQPAEVIRWPTPELVKDVLTRRITVFPAEHFPDLQRSQRCDPRAGSA